MTDARVPHVSVLMTVFNGEAYLKEAVASVLAQEFREFELLVVDDASTDGSFAALRDFAERDTRLRVLRSETNGGPVSASNIGLAEVRGSLIARLDADDVCHPERLARQVAAFDAQPQLVLLGTAVDYIDDRGRRIGAGCPAQDDPTLRRELLDSNPFCHSSMMMRADAIRAIGGYRQLVNRYALDYDLALRLSERGAIANLPEPMVGYRIHRGQITAGKLEQQLRSAHVYRALARQRRLGGGEDLASALAETDASRAEFRDALVRGYLDWADMMGGFDPEQARQLRWRALKTAPWHPRVRRLMLARLRHALSRDGRGA